MSYTKTTWSTGDIITAEKLNNIETGIKNNDDNTKFFLVNLESQDMQNFTADHTLEQLLQAYNNGYNILAKIGHAIFSMLPITSNDQITGFSTIGTNIMYLNSTPFLIYIQGMIGPYGAFANKIEYFTLTPVQNNNSQA